MTKKASASPRRLARRLALQAIYQWQISTAPPAEIESQFLETQSFSKVDVAYFLELVRAVPQSVATIDEHLRPVLDRPLEELNPVELAILRLAIYELVYCPAIPYRVVIDETLRLAKTFGAIEGYKYVNGVLDRIAKKIRAVEIQMAGH